MATKYKPFNLSQIAKMADMSMHTLYDRVNTQKMTLEEALKKPVRKRRPGARRQVNSGYTAEEVEISKKNGISMHVLRNRKSAGYSIEEAITLPIGSHRKSQSQSEKDVKAILDFKSRKIKSSRKEFREIQRAERRSRVAIYQQIESLIEIECCGRGKRCKNCSELDRLRGFLYGERK